MLIGDVDIASARTNLFEKLGNSLGALGLLIDMLSYQRAMAKKLFVYDEEAGEFKPLMGRERSQIPEASPAPFRLEPRCWCSATLPRSTFPASSGKNSPT